MLFFALALPTVASAIAAERYIDPAGGDDANPGTAAAPWRSIQKVLNEKRYVPGDTLYLLSGQHGYLRVLQHRPVSRLTIKAAPRHKPRLLGLRVDDSQKIQISGLLFDPSAAEGQPTPAIIDVQRSSTDITLENITVQSAPSVEGWDAGRWRVAARHGVVIAGKRSVVRDSHIRHVRDGITSFGSHAEVVGNVIEKFSGDGIRGLGDFSRYEANLIQNCFDVDDNHDDGFQSWSIGPTGRHGEGVVKGVVLRRNRIFNFGQQRHSLECRLQGIGLFDGFFEDWVIENNIVVVNHWHGITVMGGRRVRIANNVALDANETNLPGPPWIIITHHKDGRPPEESVIANNIYEPPASRGGDQFRLPKAGVLASGNVIVRQKSKMFIDANGLDFELAPGSLARRAGDPSFAPAQDINGTPRGCLGTVDAGVYESSC